MSHHCEHSVISWWFKVLYFSGDKSCMSEEQYYVINGNVFRERAAKTYSPVEILQTPKSSFSAHQGCGRVVDCATASMVGGQGTGSRHGHMLQVHITNTHSHTKPKSFQFLSWQIGVPSRLPSTVAGYLTSSAKSSSPSPS